MADLNELNATIPVKLVGADSAGAETNFANVTAGGAAHANLRSASGVELLGTQTVANSICVTFPSNTVLATDAKDFSGNTITYMAIEAAVATNKSMISVANTGSSPVVIKSIYLINDQVTPVTGVIAEFRLLRFTTQSGGTLITGITSDTNDSDPGTVFCKTGATLTSLGTAPYRRAKYSTDEWGTGALDTESSDHAFQVFFPFYTPTRNAKPITLRQNEGITVQQVATATVGTFTLIVEVTL